MRKVIVFVNLTLDGHLSGPAGELDWMLSRPDQEMNLEFTDAMRARVDTIVSGRNMHGAFQANFAAQAADPASPPELVEFARWMLDTPTEVFSRNTGDIAEVLPALKARPGKDMVLFGGVETVQEVVRLGLADEYWIKLYPAALGAGRPMVTQGPLDLTLVESRTYDSGIVTLRYLAPAVAE
jgi:dihydrofolate reductase